jgi:predicted O-methyltransferase YrrM
MTRILDEELTRWESGIPSTAPRPDVIARYERHELTEQLAEVLERVALEPGMPTVPVGSMAKTRRLKGATASLREGVARSAYTVSREGVRSFLRKIVRSGTRPMWLPVAIRELRDAISHLSDVEQFVDFVYGFDCHGIQIAPWQERAELVQLLQLLQKTTPRTIVEIGTGSGGTLFLLARVARPDATLISVDLPHGEFGGGYPSWRVPLFRAFAGEQQHIELIRANSHLDATRAKVARLLAGRPLDFLFIDGDHTYEGVRTDFTMYGSLVGTGGIVAFHDIVPGQGSPDRSDAAPPKGCGPDIRCVGDVPLFWNEVRSGRPSTEFVSDWDQGAFGIGVLLPGTEASSPDAVETSVAVRG